MAHRLDLARDRFELTPATPGTDAGWVYAAVKNDGSWVFDEGRIDNCMECHVDAGVDRVFGPPRSGAVAEWKSFP